MSAPRSLALAAGRALGALLSIVMRSRQRLIVGNLCRAFPEKSEAEARAIASQVWRNLGLTAAEFIRVGDINADNAGDFFAYSGFDELRAAAAETGVIYATAHFCNWEMLGIGTQYATGRLTAIARPMKNPLVEAWVQAKRARGGMDIILHRQAVRASLKALKARRIVGILFDQNLYTGGLFADFLGRPAATTSLPALLHERTGAPVFLAYGLRENGRHHIRCERVVLPNPPGDADARIAANTRALNDALGAVVRCHPGLWFWIHNRWKRVPKPGEVFIGVES